MSDEHDRWILCSLLEEIMRFARNDKDLIKWAADHKSLINDELTEKEREHLRGVYKELMSVFLEKDAA